MHDLNFLYNDDFVSFLKENGNIDEFSIIPELEKTLVKHNIILKDVFFLKGYLCEHKKPEINSDLVQIFNKAIHLNEKSALLEYLVINDYDKNVLEEMIDLELKQNFINYSQEDIECYKYDLNEYLRQLKKRG